jgi:hypothetical protein
MLDRRAAVHDDGEPTLVSDPGRVPVHDPELEPQASCAGRHGLLGVRHAQLGAAEDVDDVERPGRGDGLLEGPERGDAEDVAFERVHRHAFEALVDEVAEDPKRRPRRLRRGADDRDPAAGPEDRCDSAVVEEWDRSATLVEVEVGDRPVALGATVGIVDVCQVAPSLT